MSKTRRGSVPRGVGPTFEDLLHSIRGVDAELAAQAKRAVNVRLTLRNWLIGHDIAEYEQNGADRASYGAKLLENLSARLAGLSVSRAEERELRRYRLFYQTYPQIRESVPPKLTKHLAVPAVAPPSPIRESATPEFATAGKELISRLSFTHIAELIAIQDPTKRAFHERECLRGNGSVRELKRQIASLDFERSGLSHDEAGLADRAQSDAEPASLRLEVRDPYIFEFLGLKPKEVMSESHLEDQLLDRLQEFLLELGHGFCFEARQKRVLIGDHHGFIDLVFYHRILQCHVLIELKLEEFSHENIGQLNTYVSWYARNVMSEGDNPPVGILLCTQKDHALVEYALAGPQGRDLGETSGCVRPPGVRRLRRRQGDRASYDRVAAVLKDTFRASSAVECMNSVLRMQQSRHRRMTQPMLDRKRPCWNCHAFRSGPRKDVSPCRALGLDLPTFDFWALLRTDPGELTQRLSTTRNEG
jgi:predicted nuclease of restriction endonuclease-like (RecB) superfamily